MVTPIARPAPQEFHANFKRYFDLVPDGDLGAWMSAEGARFDAMLAELTNAQWAHRYAPGKWSIKELVGHIIDTERIMSSRALVYARGETAVYPGFDEDAFVAASDAASRSPDSLRNEWRAVRASTVALLESLNASALDRPGFAGEKNISVRSLLWLCAGHALHHTNVMQDRYLSPVP
ncbi:MAG TPA: DinB family protein, partial [Planctomycetota bacterium]|jgi:uncharacterized protein (TIGR03083 family)|nr:DinB family protein [Planctomycetota bacterium]